MPADGIPVRTLISPLWKIRKHHEGGIGVA
eukprot:COSAG02_NODE_55380_length_291_cov_0.359375_1_plen_29_part_10